jgi:hypothetical protein
MQRQRQEIDAVEDIIRALAIQHILPPIAHRNCELIENDKHHLE